MIINSGIVEKSVPYGARYNSSNLNQGHKIIYGESFLIDGFILEDIKEVNSLGESTPGANLTIKLSPGKFSSDGVLISIKETVVFSYTESPRAPKVVVAYTNDNKEDTPVIVDMISPVSVTNKMAVIGYYYPSSITLNESSRKSLSSGQFPSYRSSTRARMKDLAAMVSNGTQIFSRKAIDFAASRVGAFYRIFVDNIVLAKGDHRILVFFMGGLLEEETHYVIESPGSILIRATESLGRVDGSDITFADYADAFIDILFSDDFVFRERHGFLSPEDGGNNKLKFGKNNKEYIINGEAYPFIFSNDRVQVGGGTLVGFDRYSLSEYSEGGDERESLELYKRPGWENELNNGWTSDEYVASAIATITIIGVKALQGSQTHYREANITGALSLPVVYKNAAHATDEVQYVDSKIPYMANTGQLQVWVDGRLCPSDHFYANHLNCTASTTPHYDDKTGKQFYINDLSAGSFEIGTIPVVTSRFASQTHTSSQAKTIVSAVLRPNYLLGKTVHAFDGSATFAGLEESIGSPGIAEAVFNEEVVRHWDPTPADSEFYSTSLGTFNGNYFVTFESLAGMESGAPSASLSLLTTLTMSVGMFSDVPIYTGLALSASSLINYSTNGYLKLKTPPKGYNDELLTSSTGLYTVGSIEPDEFISDKNPIITYGGLQAFMSNWADALGFANAPDVTPREYDFSAGMSYSASGEVKSSFAGWLANREELGLNKNLSLVQCIENVVRGVGTTEFTFGYSHGYAFGGCVINLYNGKIGRFEGSSNTAKRHPDDTEFKNGIYFGNIGFEPPYKVFTNSSAIAGIKNDPNRWYAGIITPGQSGVPFGSDEIGYRALTVNNIVAIVAPSSGGANVCKYQFCYLTPGTARITQADPKNTNADLGLKIYCDNGKPQGNSKIYQIAKWMVIGPTDTEATSSLGSRFLSGDNDENWYRIDEEFAPID